MEEMVTVPSRLIARRDAEIHDLRYVLAKVRNTIEMRKQQRQPLSLNDVLDIYQRIVDQAQKDYR